MRTIRRHPHTGLPITPIGRRKNGRLIWPILGASEGDSDVGDDAEDEGDDAGDESDDSSDEQDDVEDSSGESDGDWKSKFEAQQRLTRKLERRTKKDMARIKALEAAQDEADELDPEAVAALENANARIVKSEVKAAAKGVLADPADAYKFLDLTQFEVDDDGNVDEDEIADAIDELVKEKPYLAAQGGRRFKGDASGGVRKGPKKPSLESQIAEATKARDFTRVVRLKQQLAAEQAASK